jgi:hypothetical protein
MIKFTKNFSSKSLTMEKSFSLDPDNLDQKTSGFEYGSTTLAKGLLN